MSGPLSGNSYLITGSTDGIGRHTAEKLCRAGAHVIIHGRSSHRVNDVAESLSSAPGTVSTAVADFSNFSDVRRLAAEVQSTLAGRPLTALVNNAGTFEQQRSVTADGLEKTWAVNVAAPYLLVSLLLESISLRIVNVASISAAGSIDFDNLNQERGFSSHGAYSLSKLCNIMFSMELAERLAVAGRALPTSNALDPGTVNTKMLFAGWGPIGMRIEDANDQYKLTTDPALESVTGKYFISARERQAPSLAYDAEARRKLWKVLQEQTGAQWSV